MVDFKSDVAGEWEESRMHSFHIKIGSFSFLFT